MKIGLADKVLQIHYFGEKLLVKTNDGIIPLNKQASFIVDLLFQRGSCTVDEITAELMKTYKIETNNLDPVKKIILSFVQGESLSKLLFDLSGAPREKTILQSGQPGRYIPYVLNVEITNVCNLNCFHCYKQANDGKPVFMDTERLHELFLFLNSNNLSVTLTGGECTLHPNFSRMVDLANNYARVDIVTNGLDLYSIPDETIKRLNLIGISLYGTSNEMYFKNTGIRNGLDKLERTIEKLKGIGKEFIISIVLDKEKIANMEEYVKLAVKFGAMNFQIGLPCRAGRLRNLNHDNEIWFISNDEKKAAYRKLRVYQKQYANHIKILDWERTVYETKVSYNDLWNPANFYPPHCMKCGAGTSQWSISEQFVFKPCSFLPDFFGESLDISQFKRYVEGEYLVNWELVMKQFETDCSEIGERAGDYCNRMVDFLYDER